MPKITCVEDFRPLYRRRVPKMFYDYTQSGSFTETTFRRNERDFEKIKIRQRVGVDISDIKTRTSMAGEAVTLPAAFAPIGMLGIQNAGGEIKAAKAARDFGIPFTLSTMSLCSIEQIAEATGHPFWFQLYVTKDRDFMRDLIKRAKSAGCTQLVVTMDLPMLGQRHKDLKNNLSLRPDLKNLLNIATKPRWCLEMARTPYKSFGNVVGHAKGVEDLSSLLVWAKEIMDPSLNWDDLEAIRKEWDGPIILKGLMDVEDAKIAAERGFDTIIVSNHGGRQLDGAGSSISWLPKIADAVGERMEIILDSGVRSGMDIYRALALGASSVLLGRAMVYALGAMGQPGVTQLLHILKNELRTTMGLAGKTTVAQIARDDVYID